MTKSLDNPKIFALKTSGWYKKYDRIVCVSENAKDAFDRLYAHQFNSSVLYNVVDDEEIRAKANDQLPENVSKKRFTVMSVGRLMYQKGYDMLLRVHKRLIDEGFQYDLWIAGEGEDRSKLEKFIKENGLSGSVHLLGFVNNPYSLMNVADLLVCSSRWEGFSTFATEGVILGKPIVTTDCTGMRELLGDSQYGYIVPIDEEKIYLGLRNMIQDDALRDSYSRQAKIRGKEFNARRLTKTIENFFLSEVGMR